MIALSAIDPGFVLMLAAFALFGTALGVVHFAALGWNVHLLLHERRLAPAVMLPLLRIAVVGGGLAVASLYGAGALLACLAGVLAARAMALRIAGASS